MKLRRLGFLPLLLAAACGDDPEQIPDYWGPTGPDGSLPPAQQYDSGAPGPVADSGVWVGTGDSSTPNPNPGNTGGGLPCEVDKILKEKCQTCHGEPLASGPMPLITRAHLLATNTSGVKYADRVKARINDTAKPMPPVGRPQLTAQEKQTLESYINGGVQASTCQSTTTPDAGTNPQTPDDSEYIPPDSECEVMLEIRAHGRQTPNDSTPFQVPGNSNHYEMFYQKPTWTKKMHVIRIDPIIDNGAVLHHWLLYMEDGNGGGDGTHQEVQGLHPGAQLLSGWAPGNKSLPLGRDVGMQVIAGPNARFGMEIHYNTAANPQNRSDRSGARLCLTSKLRPKEAATHWLGTQAIWRTPVGAILGRDTATAYEAGGRCTVPKEAHIIAYSPHMHTRGIYAKSIITKKSGEKVTLNDGPFNFEDQQIYPVKTATGAREIVVQPGDTIQTTCGYKKEAFTFGPGTEEEMCYNFVVAWPVGSLAGPEGAVGGKNTCIDPGT